MNKDQTKIVAIVLCIAALICIGFGISKIVSDDYKFYEDHYYTCRQGYSENLHSANQFSYGSLFYNAYKGIADDYKRMADADKEELDKLKTRAGISIGIGVALLVSAGVLVYRMDQKGSKELAESAAAVPVDAELPDLDRPATVTDTTGIDAEIGPLPVPDDNVLTTPYDELPDL